MCKCWSWAHRKACFIRLPLKISYWRFGKRAKSGSAADVGRNRDMDVGAQSNNQPSPVSTAAGERPLNTVCFPSPQLGIKRHLARSVQVPIFDLAPVKRQRGSLQVPSSPKRRFLFWLRPSRVLLANARLQYYYVLGRLEWKARGVENAESVSTSS